MALVQVLSNLVDSDFFPITVQHLLDTICATVPLEELAAWTDPLFQLKNQDNYRYSQLRHLIFSLLGLLETSPDKSSTDLQQAIKTLTTGLTMSFQKPHLEKLVDSLNNSKEEVKVLSGELLSTQNAGTNNLKRKADTDTSTTLATGKGECRLYGCRFIIWRRIPAYKFHSIYCTDFNVNFPHYVVPSGRLIPIYKCINCCATSY